ncbi:MAG: ABC transporter ATP-binding protein, partial [Kiloniellales bacterium]
AVEPDVLLLDEPLGALDLKLRRQMQDELKAIQRRVGTTFVHVTHDQEEAMAIADEIVVMNQGRIEDLGAPQRVYLRPRSLFAAGFMGEVNFLSGRIESASETIVTLATELGRLSLPAGCLGSLTPSRDLAVKLCIRPEHLKPGQESDGLVDLGPGRIVEEAFFGTHYRCHLKLESQPQRLFTAHLPQSAGLSIGDSVMLRFDPAAAVILPSDQA